MVRVLVEDGAWPWPVVMRLVRFVEASGDIVPDGRVVVSGDLDLSCNAWTFGARRFEVNSFWLDDPDCWFYELYELGQPSDRNDYLDVRVPNVNPDPNSGVFTPDDAGRVTLNVFGTWVLPWPVLTHFVAAVEASGDIVSRSEQLYARRGGGSPKTRGAVGPLRSLSTRDRQSVRSAPRVVVRTPCQSCSVPKLVARGVSWLFAVGGQAGIWAARGGFLPRRLGGIAPACTCCSSWRSPPAASTSSAGLPQTRPPLGPRGRPAT
jgi:hypothetical protein